VGRQPVDIVATAFAKLTQRRFAHCAFLLRQIVEHVGGGILDPRLALVAGAAGVDDAAAGCRGAAAVKSVDRDDISAKLSRLKRRHAASAAQADYDNICRVRPHSVIARIDYQRIIDAR